MSDENTTQPIARINGKWAPGQSGNPAGRPRDEQVREVREKCLSALPEMIDEMVSIFKHPKTRPAVKAAIFESFWDRGIGKPTQTLAATVENVGEEREMSDFEAARRIAFVLELGSRSRLLNEAPTTPALPDETERARRVAFTDELVRRGLLDSSVDNVTPVSAIDEDLARFADIDSAPSVTVKRHRD